MKPNDEKIVTVKRCDYCRQPIRDEKVIDTDIVLIVCNLDCACRGVHLFSFAVEPHRKLFEEDGHNIAVNVRFAEPKHSTP
jgi:hypothetical protein